MSSFLLDNVTFSYDGKVDVLKNVSFKIPAGTSAALVWRIEGRSMPKTSTY
jgi:ABC-type multidrug transport system fused ATPase/permease subunit